MSDPTPPTPPPPADVAQAVERLTWVKDGGAKLYVDRADLGLVLAHLAALQSRVADAEHALDESYRLCVAAELDAAAVKGERDAAHDIIVEWLEMGVELPPSLRPENVDASGWDAARVSALIEKCIAEHEAHSKAAIAVAPASETALCTRCRHSDHWHHATGCQISSLGGACGCPAYDAPPTPEAPDAR